VLAVVVGCVGLSSMVLASVVLVVVLIVMIIMVVIVIVMLIMVVVVVVMVAACRSKSSNITNSNHVNVSDLLITVEPTRKLQPPALFYVTSINNIVVHFANQVWRVQF
jgi:hypothetical protein